MARAESHLAVSEVAAGSAHLTKGMENWQRACALASAVVLGLTLVAASSAEEQTLTVLYNFKGSPDGSTPVAGLVRDAAGNLYGTTNVGGNNNGTVFEVTSQGTEKILHTFKGNPDGSQPWAGLVQDAAGNLYGTTAYGGAFNFGTVFKVTKAGKERVLYSFRGAPDGATPFAGLIRDSAGNLYGTTLHGGSGSCNGGGAQGCGTVFMLSAGGTETVLYSFAGGTDGERPAAGLVRDSAGNLYGTTVEGGGTNCSDPFVNGCGTVFMISNAGSETILHSFTGNPTDGEGPFSSLIIGANGNLYGTTMMGGAYTYGTVFELTITGTETVLHSFGAGSDGKSPAAGLIQDRRGNLYSTTEVGGGTGCAGNGCGTVFRLTKTGKETVLVAFPDTSGGSIPFAGLIPDTAGNLYGTTSNGGTSGGPGIVFKLTP